MKFLLLLVRCDLVKWKRTYLPWLHILLPMLVGAIFVLYARQSTLEPSYLIELYLSFITAFLPMITAIVSSKVVEMEAQAGQFYHVLSLVPSKGRVFTSKVVGLTAVAIVPLVISLAPILNVTIVLRMVDLLICIGFLVVMMLTMYAIHLSIAYLFGSAITIGVGVFGTIFTFLLATVLGDSIWYYFPNVWGLRFILTYLRWLNDPQVIFFQTELQKGISIAIVMTLFVFCISHYWFSKWEGRTVYE